MLLNYVLERSDLHRRPPAYETGELLLLYASVGKEGLEPSTGRV